MSREGGWRRVYEKACGCARQQRVWKAMNKEMLGILGAGGSRGS